MGQYWFPVNLDKREFIDPHKLGSGLKLAEQVGTFPGTASALLVLCAAQPEKRGGGDLDLVESWHGPMPEGYPPVARRTIGRWAGDRIALIGDYAKDSDLSNPPQGVFASKIYKDCLDGAWRDVSGDVARVLEHELGGRFSGDGGWRTWHEEVGQS